MAIAATGAVSFSDLRSEFVGGSSAISYSDLYRGGSNIRAKAANNTGVNLAASVPTSGTINITNFRSQAKGFKFTFSSTATDQNASALFGSDYSVNYPKEIVINSGVELGATSTTEEALEIDSGGAGTITVTNNGTLTGAGGGVGAAGGDAFEAAVNCTFVNNGTVRAGGGGGGAGGNGGGGSYSSSSQTGNGTSNYWTVSRWWRIEGYYGGNGGFDGYNFGVSANQTSKSAGSSVYYRGNYVQSMDGVQYYYIYRVTNNTYSTNGGAGGSGAVGAGYNQSAGSGSSGSGGGTNAGTGGAGGNGGAFGAAGSSGGTGTNGNASNGSSGAAGGASGAYLRGLSFVTFTNNGTAQGSTA